MQQVTKQLWIDCPACGHQEALDSAVGPAEYPPVPQGPWPGHSGGRWPASCPACGGEWLDLRYDYGVLGQEWSKKLAQRPFGMWRYWELLPLQDIGNALSMGEGGTPLVQAVNLGMMLGRPNIYIKDERQGPTGSFKDRQAALAISVMKEQGITEAVVASTGNVAISYSAYSALAGIKLWTFLTSSVPADKMREVALYGSEVIKVTGTYDQTKKVAADFARRKGLHLDAGIKSFAAKESMKTVAFEIAEQLRWFEIAHRSGQYHPSGAGLSFLRAPIDGLELADGDGPFPLRAPDWYFQAVSGGLGPVGVWKGFKELYDMGLIDRIPKLACIQAEGCAPMVHSFAKGLEVAEPVENPMTLITTVATGYPGLAYTFLQRVIRERGGAFEAVSDDDAFRAMHVMAKMDGISMEPAAGLAFGGLFKMVSAGVIKPEDVVVVNCSGHTFPVEKHLLGDTWARNLDASEAQRASGTEEGLLTSLDRLDTRVRRVAIVEDDPDARRLLRRILQARGEYQVMEAADGRAGLALVREQLPDLVLLDLMMPEMDGFEVLEEIRADKRLADTRIIVITAKTLTAGERRRLSEQAEALLQKGSFLDDDLGRGMEEILGTLP
ncbi:MAG: pyridoxal-phosphate dependent enzyme [Anaerolineae bacterium]|nr:pyridoxal-phosphate dependent enzyme [Anaerolineae bacterium]